MEIIKKNIHFIGIGGSGMCGIAEVLFTMGHFVSGSDTSESKTIDRLKDMGIKICLTHNPKHVEGKDVVVYSSAIDQNNPELERAKELKIPILPRGQMLAELMVFKLGIAIAGTHGKTTTTSILASIFSETKLDPTIVIGGKFSNINSNAKPGKGDFLIAEVDESDRSFLKTLPTIATITNIDVDHICMFDDKNKSYETFEDIVSAFSTYMRKIPILGKIILNRDDEKLFELSQKQTRNYIFYSLKEKNATFYADQISFDNLKTHFNLYFQGIFIGKFKINILGEHNVSNALAAIATAYSVGIGFKEIGLGLENFIGIERRLEFLINNINTKVVLDYCHHPSEIKCTLKTLKEAFNDYNLTVIFQPHRYSRTKYLFNEFTSSFKFADKVYITDIYSASEKPISGISGKALAGSTNGAIHLNPTPEFLQKLFKSIHNEKTVVLFAGAGDIYKSAKELVNNFV